MSAWRVVLDEVISAREIYEFDLKQYFSRVSLDAISTRLVQFGVPNHVVAYLRKINQISLPRMPKERLTDESELYALNEEGYGVPQGASTSPWLAILPLDTTLFCMGFNRTIQYADDGL